MLVSQLLLHLKPSAELNTSIGVDAQATLSPLRGKPLCAILGWATPADRTFCSSGPSASVAAAGSGSGGASPRPQPACVWLSAGLWVSGCLCVDKLHLTPETQRLSPRAAEQENIDQVPRLGFLGKHFPEPTTMLYLI